MNFGEAMYVVLRGGIVYRTHGNFEDSGLPSQRIRLDEGISGKISLILSQSFTVLQ